MPLNRIINRAIEANAVVAEKIANGSVTTSKIADGTITEDKFTIQAVNSIAALRLINVSGPSGIGFTDLNSIETVTINGSGFQSGARIFLDEFEVSQANITYRNTNTIDFVVPRLTPDKYHVYVYNPDGGSVVKPIGLQFVSPPTWQTFSITSATQYDFYNTTVVATSLETLTYSLVGAIPQGLSLTTGGTISGYPIASPGSYFIGVTTKTASGVENTRYFTLNLAAGSFVANVDVLTVAGGGGGAMGGGGAGGFRIASNLTVSSTGNVSVIVGGGGGFSYQNSFNNLDQPGYNSQIRGGTGGVSSFSANGIVLLQSSGGGGGGAGFGSTAWANSGSSGGGGGISAGAAFLQTGLVQIGSGGSGNTGNYTPAEGYAGGNGGYNTSLTAANFNASVYGLPYEKAGGGGGGAGGPGSTVVSAAASPTGGAGGPAIYSTFTGANVAYAGGGGGGGGIAGGAGGGAGAGSGAGSNNNNSASGGDALPNTGSGGGGMKFGYPMTSNDTPTGTPTTRSGTGGSGIVIAKLYPTFGFFTGGNLLNQTGGVSVYEFKTSNTFVFSSNLSDIQNTPVVWVATTLSNTIRGSNYYVVLQAQSSLKLFYQLESGSLPQGLTLNQITGELAGVVGANAVTSSFTIKAINVAGVFASVNLSISVQTTFTAEYLMIGGGGGGGGTFAGGGGAGGVLSSNISLPPGQTVQIIVGSGGTRNISGGNSSIITSQTTITSIGGGRGGTQTGYDTTTPGQSINGTAGGSGGGGAGGDNAVPTNGTGGAGTAGQGFAGGSGAGNTPYTGAGGGGGGAGGTGFNAAGSRTGGAGGSGTPTYSTWATDTNTGVSGVYAGGGAGGSRPTQGGSLALGGAGGGGNSHTSAVANTGSGGGGGGGDAGELAGNGGSGLVLIRYTGTPLSIGGNIQIVSGYTYHIFKTSGNLFVGGTGPIWVSPNSGVVLTDMVNGSAYTISFVGDGLYKPLTYTLISGSLPPGLSLNSSTGVLSGTISTAATAVYDITIRISDTINSFSDRTFRLGINGGLRVDLEILAIGGGGGNGALDGSSGGGSAGGGGGGAFSTVSIFPGASMSVYVGGGGFCNGGESRGFSNPGGVNGGGPGGASGLSGSSGAGGGGGGWSGVYYNNNYLVVAGGGGGGGGGGEGTADNFVGTPGGYQPDGTSGSMTGGTGQAFGSGDGGSAGGGGGGYEGGIGGSIAGPGANGGTNFGSSTYAGFGTSSATIPSNLATSFNYTNQSYGNAGGYISSGSPGIVIIQYSGTEQKLSGGVVNISGGKVRHVFTTTGPSSITY